MKKSIFLILNARSIGGVEKRFLQYFKYLSSQETKFRYIIFINKALVAKLGIDLDGYKSSNTIIVQFGASKINKVWEFLSLSIKIIYYRFRYNYSAVHLVTTLSLRHRFLFDSRKIITSIYTSVYPKKKIESKLYQKLCKEGVYFDCLTKYAAKHVLSNDLIRPSKEKVFTSPCSFINYNGTEYNYENKENIIVFAGRLSDQKGVELLLETLPLLARNIPEYKIHIFGEGSWRKKIEKEISCNNFGNKIELSFVPDIKPFLLKSKIFLSLQKIDNYPSQSLIEAMACGNAIIATNEGLTNEIVNSNSGILIDRNKMALYHSIRRLVDNDHLIRDKAKYARRFVLKNHTIEKFHKYITNVYDVIVRKQKQ